MCKVVLGIKGAELLYQNGFKEAYAIGGGVWARKGGWYVSLFLVYG